MLLARKYPNKYFLNSLSSHVSCAHLPVCWSVNTHALNTQYSSKNIYAHLNHTWICCWGWEAPKSMLSHDHEMLLIVASNSVSSEHRLPVDLHQRRVFSLVDSFFYAHHYFPLSSSRSTRFISTTSRFYRCTDQVWLCGGQVKAIQSALQHTRFVYV